MRITTRQLRQIIREVILSSREDNINEGFFGDLFGSGRKLPSQLKKYPDKWKIAQKHIPKDASSQDVFDYADWLRDKIEAGEDSSNLKSMSSNNRFQNFKEEQEDQGRVAKNAEDDARGKKSLSQFHDNTKKAQRDALIRDREKEEETARAAKTSGSWVDHRQKEKDEYAKRVRDADGEKRAKDKFERDRIDDETRNHRY